MFGLSAHQVRRSSDPSRRGFLITMMGAGVMLGYMRSNAAAQPTSTASDLFEPTIWHGIDPSGMVTVNIIRAEIGQHVGTALARIVADELEADWNNVRTVSVDSDPKWGVMMTGGSLSVWQSFPLLSRAGAAGRIALIEAGANLLGAIREVVRPATASCMVTENRFFTATLWRARICTEPSHRKKSKRFPSNLQPSVASSEKRPRRSMFRPR